MEIKIVPLPLNYARCHNKACPSRYTCARFDLVGENKIWFADLAPAPGQSKCSDYIDRVAVPVSTPWFWNILAPKIESGATRYVLLIGAIAIKIPRFSHWRTFLNGLLANMQERTFATTDWPELCPVIFADPIGLIVIMPRCEPLTPAEWIDFDYRSFVNRDIYVIPAENKRSSFGRLRGRIVALDYG